MPNFTSEQMSAIEFGNCDLLVSAAAGSGKTAVLVERIKRIALNEQNPIYLDRLLVVTFTEAAANEMKRRLERELQEEFNKNPQNSHIEKQLMLLNKAYITTIHSFCLRVVRKYFSIAGVDPLFRVADQTEIELLKTKILSELFEDLYTPDNKELFVQLFGQDTNIRFLETIEVFGDKVKDDSLQRLILRIYAFSQSHPFPGRWLDGQAICKYDSIQEVEQAEWYMEFKGDCNMILTSALFAAEDAISRSVQCPYLPAKNLTVLQDDRDNIQKAIKALNEGFVQFYNAMEFNFDSFAGGKAKKCKDGTFTDEQIKQLRELIKTQRDNYIKKPIENLCGKALPCPPDMLIQGLRASGRLISTLCAITNEFSKRFYEAKRLKNIADFNDFEHLCLKVLVDPCSAAGNIIPTQAALEMRENFYEVMVDEYQDSNMVQEMILTSVSKRGDKEKNMFMVGDAKQSIYKFRLADPSIFMNKYEAYKRGSAGAKLITLSKNFRSRESVINSINCIFEKIMSKEFGEIDYDSRSKLYYGGLYLDSDSDLHKTELLIVDTLDGGAIEDNLEDEGQGAENEYSPEDKATEYLEELSYAELEARLAATRIKQLIESGFAISEKDSGARPLRYSDIVILLRSHKIVSETFINVLQSYGIPAFSDASGSYFEEIEVLVALSFLKIVDNPLQDIPLISVLHSPVYSFSSDELAQIRQTKKNTVFFNALEMYAESGENLELKEKVQAFLKQLLHFRKISAYTPVNELIWIIYNETNILNYLCTQGGEIKQANLMALFLRAVEYERTSFKGLFHFIKYIEKLQDGKLKSDTGTLGTAKVLNENSNLVKIMSIHKSKGLEFPVVLVCGLNKKCNLQDLNTSLVMHRNLGMASVSADITKRVISNTLPEYVIKRRILKENLSEELRILYVALTRAKEKLILIGSMKNAAKYISNMPGFLFGNGKEHIPSYLIAQKTYLKWVLPAVYKAPNQTAGWFKVEIYEKGSLTHAETDISSKYTALAEELENIDINADYSGQKQLITKRLSYKYPLKMSMIPSKLSVSEIKRRYDSQWLSDSDTTKIPINTEVQFRKPEFLKKSQPQITPPHHGTIMHMVMEHMPQNLTELEPFLYSLYSKGILSEAEFQNVDRNGILLFLKSNIYDRMSRAVFIKKETRFVIGLSPGVIDKNYACTSTTDISKDEEMLVHGIIDCVFEEAGKMVIVDYKTDSLYNKDPNEHSKVYHTQMNLYRIAIEKILQKPVSQVLLYFFDGGYEVPLPLH